MLIRVMSRLHGLSNARRVLRTKSHLWLPELDAVLPKQNNVLVLHTPAGETEARVIVAHNIITDAGDIYYSQKQCGQAPTNAFSRLVVGTGKTGAWTKNGSASQYGNLTGPIAASNKTVDATYPMVPDSDASNTGLGNNVTSWRWSYTSTDFTSATAVTDGCIIATAGPVTATPTLAGFTLSSSFTIATGDSVKVFVNHTMLGV